MTEQPRTGAWPIVDFHVHIRPPWWQFSPLPGASAADLAWQASWVAKLTDPQRLVGESDAAGVTLNLLSSTVEGISGISGPADQDEIRRHNDYLAELVAAHPGKLAALATVDAFSGEAGAREAERAVEELGHVGIVIDSARDDAFAGSSATWPVFEAADRLGVPILVHPVAAPNAAALTRSAGRPGNSFGRGHVNGTAFLTILENGIPDRHPDLDVVFTGIGIGALAIAAAEVPAYGFARRQAGGSRPGLLALAVLGPELVLVVSDWPIWEPVSAQKLTEVFDAAAVAETYRALIASGNALRVLGRRRSDATAFRLAG
ncbi:MAG: amidohydrolase family protein [Rhizobiales bacterium]|nr:amidohydrolase family protein [Hyphomicrobiales bacterium]